ncbi:MAG: ABC transporter permease, partial [Desulfovermiculus sp.]
MRKPSGWSLIKLYTLLVYFWMFAPILVVIILSFNPKQFGTFPMQGFSLKWYGELFTNETIIRAFQVSLLLGSLTAILTTAIGIPAAMAFIRYDFPGKNTLNTLLLSPIMIPEVVLGVALLLFLRWLQQPKSFLLLLIGHCVLTLPYVLLVVQARLVGIKKSYEEASQTLGANPLHTFREVTFPLLTPAILAGMLFSFSISF